jgi:uncharacterized membrane protein YukC
MALKWVAIFVLLQALSLVIMAGYFNWLSKKTQHNIENKTKDFLNDLQDSFLSHLKYLDDQNLRLKKRIKEAAKTTGPLA